MTEQDASERPPQPTAWARTRRFLATRHGRLVAGGTAAVLVVGAGGGAVFAAGRAEDSRYRTAVAEIGEIAETLALTGQISSDSSSSAAFQVAGSVAEVLVSVGDEVTAGQVLARLDSTDLDAALTQAEDALAQAEEQLEDDLEAQQNGTASGSTSSPGRAGPSASGPGAGGASPDAGNSAPDASSSPAPGSGSSVSEDPTVTAASQAVAAAQDALLARYSASSQARATSSAATADAQSVCAPFLSATVGQDGTLTGDDLAGSQIALSDCQQALTAALSAQQATADEQDALDAAAKALDDAVSKLRDAISAAEAPSASGGATTSSSRGTTSGAIVTASFTAIAATPDAGGGSDARSTSTAVTSETILADRAAIDLAEAQRDVAKQERQFATLHSAIEGTVVSVAMAVGDSVSADSDSAVITVQGAGGFVVEATVTLAKIAKVEVGQSAEVTLPALGATYPASVSDIGVRNVSETSTPAYTVTLAVDAGEEDLRIGATAQAVVTLSTVADVLTVPTSAVTTSGASTTVTVLEGGEAKSAPVAVGAVGAERTEIVDGIAEGDVVVLADLSASISADEETSSTGLTGLTGLGGSATSPGSGRFPGGGQPPSGGSLPAPPGS